MIRTHALLDNLDHIRAETLKRLDGLTQTQLDWRPPDGEWSLMDRLTA